MKKRSESGKKFPYVKAVRYERKGGAKGKHGHLDMRVRRRDGPVCETCKRHHYPFQGCWAGPDNLRRDWKEIHRLLDEMTEEMYEVFQALWDECEEERHRIWVHEETKRIHAQVKHPIVASGSRSQPQRYKAVRTPP